jgi:hypothetical protein
MAVVLITGNRKNTPPWRWHGADTGLCLDAKSVKRPLHPCGCPESGSYCRNSPARYHRSGLGHQRGTTSGQTGRHHRRSGQQRRKREYRSGRGLHGRRNPFRLRNDVFDLRTAHLSLLLGLSESKFALEPINKGLRYELRPFWDPGRAHRAGQLPNPRRVNMHFPKRITAGSGEATSDPLYATLARPSRNLLPAGRRPPDRQIGRGHCGIGRPEGSLPDRQRRSPFGEARQRRVRGDGAEE